MMKTIKFQMKVRAAAAVLMVAATMLAGCKKYDDSAVRGRLDDHEQRLASLESAVAVLDAQIKAGAMIKSVTPLATAPGGWRIEFTGGSPSSIDILNGAQGTPGTTPATPQIEVRTGADGTVSIWYNVGGDWKDTGTNIKGPQGDPGSPGTPGTPGTPGAAGVSPQVRVVDNEDGTVTIRYNTTAGYPADGWTDAGTPIALDSNPRDKEAIFSIVKNEATGTITITLNDSDVPAERTAFDFAMASGAARIELVGFNDKVTIAEGATARIKFVVNPSDAWVPLDKWELNQTGTRTGYITEPTDFALVDVEKDGELTGQYVATIRCLTHNPAVTDYAMALVLDTGTDDAPSLVSSPTFVLGTAAAEQLPVAFGGEDDGIRWALWEDGALTIYGTGAMPDYSYSGTPWNSHRQAIKTVVVGAGVTTIGRNAFYGCAALTDVTLPDNVTAIGENAFFNCAALTNITIPDGVTAIGGYAFYGCTALTDVTIPDGVATIGPSTFYGCAALTNATIGAGVTSIGVRAFARCTALANVTCLASRPPSLGGYNFVGNTADVLRVPAGSLADYEGDAAWNGVFSSIEEMP